MRGVYSISSIVSAVSSPLSSISFMVTTGVCVVPVEAAT